MFRKIPFSEYETRIVGTTTGMFRSVLNVRDTPVSARANYDALFYDKHPFWMPDIRECRIVHTPVYDDNLGRGNKKDITDVFGLRWRYVESAGGSIVEPGAPLMEDANDWRKLIRIPDVDSWDWATAAQATEIDMRQPAMFSCVNGFGFERLISYMDFMYAAMAIIDEDQIDAVKELLAELTEMGCKVIDKLCETWPGMDMIEIHDDWGSQMAPFFSLAVAEELFVPNMKKLTDRIHAWGRRALLHSCGHNAERTQCFIDGGFDLWAPQSMNDIEYLYDTYGDKIVLCVYPTETDIAQRSEAEQRAAARAFAERFCQPGKPAVLGVTGVMRSTPAFLDELYIHSRKLYLAQD